MSEKDYILFKDRIQSLKTKFIECGWITVSDKNIHSALISDDRIADALSDYQWDLRTSECAPTILNQRNGSFEYKRFQKGLEQLVMYRERFGHHQNYVELSEEFRLFAGLHEQVKSTLKEYIYDDENGNEILAGTIKGIEVKINIKKLRAYLAARKMNLLIFIDEMRYSTKSFVNIDIKPVLNNIEKKEEYIYNYSSLSHISNDEIQAGGWIVGKCLLRYNPHDFSPDSYLFTSNHPFEEFIIGYNNAGDEVNFTCEESKLSNYFQDNNGAPQATTPVFFKKTVLDKYYGDPNKYSVEDGIVKNDGVWTLKLDNDQRNYVAVILKDLGFLPHEEQLYWKTYNVPLPPSEGISQTALDRWYKGKCCDPTYPDLVFKHTFNRFGEDWKNKFGWDLYLPLAKGDEHRFKSLHCLTKAKNDNDFENQILSLTKIIVDSLNEKQLMSMINLDSVDVQKKLEELGANDVKNIKGSINKFDLYLLSEKKHLIEVFKFLHNLQELRSTWTAHRKSEHNKAKCLVYFDLVNRSEQEVSEDMLVKATSMLIKLRSNFLM